MHRIAFREYKMVTQMSHSSIIKMKEAFFNKNKETIYIVMELVDGVTLKKYLKDT